MEANGEIRRIHIGEEVLDATTVESRRSPDETMDLVPFPKEKFRKVGTILTCDASDQSSSSHTPDCTIQQKNDEY